MTNHAAQSKSLLIAQIEPPQLGKCGDYYYRTHAPGLAMAEERGVNVVTLTNLHRLKHEIVRKADILILKNICDPDFLPLIRRRKEREQLTVYEIADDLAAIPPWNPVYFFFSNKENLDLVYCLARYCDGLQFSVPQLQERYGYLNRQCNVFPNQILEIPGPKTIRNGKRLVVGWGGSHGHLEDMAEIAEPLSRWVTAQPDVKLHLMCSNAIWELFARVPENKKKRTLPGSIHDYQCFLRQIDVGIAPLKSTKFNRSRSDIKFLEYASNGVVPIVAQMEPYIESVKDGVTGLVYNNTTHLVEILDWVLKDRIRRAEISVNAYEYVIHQRNQMEHGRERVNFYLGLMEARGGQAPSENWLPCWQEWTRAKGGWKRKRYLRLLDTDFERLLYNGLVFAQQENDKQRALELYERAIQLAPNNYLPYLFGAGVSSNPTGWLQKALELYPDSLKSLIMLGDTMGNRGKLREALRTFAAASRIFPEYDVPYAKAARFLEAFGQTLEASLIRERAKIFRCVGDKQDSGRSL